MLHVHRLVARSRIGIVVVCILVALLAVMAIITAVAAQNTSATPTVRPYIAAQQQAIAAFVAQSSLRVEILYAP